MSTVRFVKNGQVIEARDIAPTTTLLDYLRETLHCTGTKEGCAEGDCGACTVLEGELRDGRVQYRAVNSCIRFLPSFDGKEVVTVEDVAADDGSLHPVQQAMLDCHASQCGFCTPGFVMSLLGLYLAEAQPDHARVVDALSGNLCRCTGYRPIIAAALEAAQRPTPDKWSRADAAGNARAELLESIQREDMLLIDDAPGYAAPRSLAELAELYAARPDALLLAGGTDVGLWVTKQQRDLPFIIHLGGVVELDSIDLAQDTLTIGAAVRLNEAYDAIARHYPALDELGRRFASVPIRNSGTFCGNIANGSPIGDSMPFLLTLEAVLELRRGGETRRLPLDQFYLGYQKKALAPGEFVAAVHIPLPDARPGMRRIVASHKISKRFDQDISAICGAYAIEIEGGTVVKARIAYGGMAAIPQRAQRAEAALVGQPWSMAAIEQAQRALAEDYRPIGDMRASAGYRLQVAGNLLTRVYLEDTSTTPVRLTLDLDADCAP